MLTAGERTSRVRGIGPMVARAMGEVLMMAVLTRATLLADLSPFVVAAFAAALAAGRPPVWMLAGCALGCAWEVLGVYAVAPLAGCLIVLGGHMLARLTPLNHAATTRNGRLCMGDALAAALAGLGALLPPLVIARGVTYDVVMAAVNGVIALAIAPVLVSAMGLSWRRTCLLTEEQLSLVVLCMLLLLGVSHSPAHMLSVPLAALITLAASTAGAGYGAAAGVALGAALAFSGPDPMLGASLGLMGLVAGATVGLGRVWAALAFFLANTAAAAFGTGAPLGTLQPLWAAAVAGAYLLIPEAALRRACGWISPSRASATPDELAERLRQSTAKRLRALGSVFSELSEEYGACPPGPDEQALIGQMRRALCTGCAGYAACWNGTDGRAGRMLCALLGDALGGTPLTEGGEVPAELGRLCRRAGQMPRKLGALLSGFEAQRRAARERKGASATLSNHFRQGARILDDLGERLGRPLYVDEDMGKTAMAALERAGFEVEDVLALDGDAVEVCATMRDALWGAEEAQNAASCLSSALGVPMRAALMPDQLAQRALRLVQSPRLTATVGYAARAREEGAPCGDSHIAAGLTGGRVLLALSDGMGSGARAAEESAATIRLIRRFLLAEIDDNLMLETVNELLLLRGGDDMFATADLCVMDLQKGEARFLKLGACASFIVRRGKAQRVEGGKLPLGILDRVSPAEHTLSLRTGDMVVMVTDGVADIASEEENLWLEAQLAELSTLAPAQLCERVIERACARPGGAKDDMTVLAARLTRAR